MDVQWCFIIFLIQSFFFSPSHTQTDSFTSVLISQNGLDFVKNLLVNKSIASIIPLQIPRIEKAMNIPFLGGIDVVVSNLTLYELDVASSYVNLGETGLVIVASGTTCNLSMNWHYSYSTWLPPIEISDQGIASVQDFKDQIRASVETTISNKLSGGVSGLDSFLQSLPKEIPVDDKAALKVRVSGLDSFLQSLPKELPVDDKFVHHF